MIKLRAASAPGFIDTTGDLKRGIRALRRTCPDMRRIHDLTGDPPLRRYEPGFEGLARIVIGQQLSISSAEAIWARTRLTVTPFEARSLMSLDDATLQAAGLSRGKIRTLRALAERIAAGSLVVESLVTSSEADAHAALTAVPGIGPWTADIFLLFCAGRADAWASGDLALQVAVQWMLDLESRPRPNELTEIAERWRPQRATAARLLWAYYRIAKEARSGEAI